MSYSLNFAKNCILLLKMPIYVFFYEIGNLGP